MLLKTDDTSKILEKIFQSKFKTKINKNVMETTRIEDNF